jgi:DNA-binding response OmpR family regulator
MKKIILTDRVRQNIDGSLLQDLSDFELFTAYSNDDALRIHRKERASLIIAELFGAGLNGRQLCAQIREDAALRGVSIILGCRDNEVELQEAAQCRANAVLTFPLRSSVLRRKIAELLRVPARGRYEARFSARVARAPLSSIDCRVENISATGMLIKADAELRQGDQLQYSLDLAPARSYPVVAVVVRNDRDRYGIRFSRIDPAALSAIEAIVGRNASRR